MIRQYSVFDLSTGLFTGRIVGASRPTEEWLKAETPDGCGLIEGVYDAANKRVDVETLEVRDYIPPQPDAEHEWTGQRWEKTATARNRDAKREAAQSRIEELERRQARAIREYVLGDESAKQRLQAINDEITARRADLA